MRCTMICQGKDEHSGNNIQGALFGVDLGHIY